MLSRAHKVMHDFIQREEIAVDFQDAIREQFDRAMDDDISDYQDQKQNVFEMAISLINLCMRDDNLKEILRNILAFATLDEEIIDFNPYMRFLIPCVIRRIRPSIMLRELTLFEKELNQFGVWALSDEQVSVIFNNFTFSSQKISRQDFFPSNGFFSFDVRRFLNYFSHLNSTQINDSIISLFARYLDLSCDAIRTFVHIRSLSPDQIIPKLVRGEQLRNSSQEVQRLCCNDSTLCCCRTEEYNLLLFSSEEIINVIHKSIWQNVNCYLVTPFFVINLRNLYNFQRYLDTQNVSGRNYWKIWIEKAFETNYLKFWRANDTIDFPESFSIACDYLKSDAVIDSPRPKARIDTPEPKARTDEQELT